MGLFDTVKCEFPLPDSRHQDLEFQTKDLERLLDRYTITADGRLVRHLRAGGRGSARDVDWPIHADIRIYAVGPDPEPLFVEYLIRFTHDRVEWIHPMGRGSDSDTELPTPQATEPARGRILVPGIRGRLLTADEFMTHAPEKLELVAGEIPDAETLLLLLLTQVGLRRVAMLMGPDRWKLALGDEIKT